MFGVGYLLRDRETEGGERSKRVGVEATPA
jgi:hypothetical protein